jgi:TolA-binding protein
MSRKIKLVLYVVSLIGVVLLGSFTMRSYREATQASERRAEGVARVVENTNALEATNALADTNLAGAETNLALAETNLALTNAVVVATNAAAAKETDTDDAIVVAGASTRGYTRMIVYGLGLLLFFIALAVLMAYDISQFLGNKAQQALFTDDGAPVSAEYEQAEELAKDGKYLEAIQAMRDYLKAHPREQYVALRIAEIYEANLFNPLAAALEYEEVLTKPLPPERWGWAAIHLANLYSGKLNQSEKAVVLLRRIDAEYGQTSAAKKARDRLTQIDPGFVPANVAEAVVAEEAVAAERSASNLPPGFRPKT